MAAVDKVLIIGGGISGLSTGIALRRAGIAVDLVESDDAWNVLQTGIVLQANAIRALASLGIAEQCVALGFSYSGLTIQDLHGRVLTDIQSIGTAGRNLPSDLALSRPRLHHVLTEVAHMLGVRVRLGVTFSELTLADDRVEAAFTDGTRDTYDLVVGADGVHSRVREALFGTRPAPRFTGQSAWRYNVLRPSGVDQPFMAMGLAEGTAGFIPFNTDTGYVILVQSQPGNVKPPVDGLADVFRSRLIQCTGVMARLRDQITDPRLVIYRPLESIFMPAPWYRGRVLLIGDAVHSITPHLGQGAAQAMEDAVVLGELLARDEFVPHLLDAFMARRYERCKQIYNASIQMGEWEQHPTPDADPVGLARLMTPLLARLT